MANKSLTKNPFAGFGKIVNKDRFSGRESEINIIEQRILGTEFSNISITGLPKIGKSSLVWTTLMDKREKLILEKIIVIFINVGTIRTAIDFFKTLANRIHGEFEDYFEQDEKYFRITQTVLEKLNSETQLDEIGELIQLYLKKINRLEYKIILILDEFDKTQYIFDLADFQLLRELSYDPDYRIGIVTTSRRALDEIETKDKQLSNFARIFSDCPIGMFTKNDIQKYWERFEKNYPTDDSYKTTVNYLVGGHPWLMDVVNNCYFENRETNLTLSEKIDKVKLEVMRGLDEMIDNLDKEGLLNAAIQVVIGPLYNVNQIEIEKLLRYGFIKKVTAEYKKRIFNGLEIGPIWDDGVFVCFSDFSTLDLYRRYYANVPYVALWTETETMLRWAVKEYLIANYTDNWEKELEERILRNPPFKSYKIDVWRENLCSLKYNMEKMIAVFPDKKSDNIVDFTLTAQIFDLFIRADWTWFHNHIFTGNREEWNQKFTFITKFRNAVAHNNISNLEEEMRIATDYCKEILNSIRIWQKNRIV